MELRARAARRSVRRVLHAVTDAFEQNRSIESCQQMRCRQNKIGNDQIISRGGLSLTVTPAVGRIFNPKRCLRGPFARFFGSGLVATRCEDLARVSPDDISHFTKILGHSELQHRLAQACARPKYRCSASQKHRTRFPNSCTLQQSEARCCSSGWEHWFGWWQCCCAR